MLWFFQQLFMLSNAALDFEFWIPQEFEILTLSTVKAGPAQGPT